MVSLTLDAPPQPQKGSGPGVARRAGRLLLLGIVAAVAFVAGRWTAPGGRFAASWGGGGGKDAAATAARAPREPREAAPGPAAPAAEQAGEASAAPAPAPAAQPLAATAGPRRIAVTLAGPLEESIAEAVPPEDAELAGELTQVVNRLLVWNLQVARDGRKGDRLEVVYAPGPGGSAPGANEPVVEALRYQSQKLSATIAAYRYLVPGARWARYFRPDGTELEQRLVDAPIPDYEQITSLLNDGRHHKGVDFRVPVGTAVHATFDGVVERRNWNFGGNGNCLDVRDPATGRHAIFLHLDVLPKDMAPGRRVKKGEQIASSGNSGHSFAPHLHYQLEDGDHRVLDPFEVQAVRRAALEPAARPAFDAERARLDGLLSGTAVVRAAASPAAVVPAAAPSAGK